MWIWVQNLGLLHEQPVLLTAEPSLQVPTFKHMLFRYSLKLFILVCTNNSTCPIIYWQKFVTFSFHWIYLSKTTEEDAYLKDKMRAARQTRRYRWSTVLVHFVLVLRHFPDYTTVSETVHKLILIFNLFSNSPNEIGILLIIIPLLQMNTWGIHVPVPTLIFEARQHVSNKIHYATNTNTFQKS